MIGKTISHCKLLEKLDRGGMLGKIYQEKGRSSFQVLIPSYTPGENQHKINWSWGCDTN
ncbi:MAG: hypothetical protein ACE5WD_00590 [Candidatus Aminicenantia bacterium]